MVALHLALAASLMAACGTEPSGAQCEDGSSMLQVTLQNAVTSGITVDGDAAELQLTSAQRLWGAGNMSGVWVGEQWRVADFANTGSDLRQLADRPLSSWPPELDGKSILILGDSLDRNAVRYFCSSHEAATGPYLEADLASLVGASSYDFCRLGGVTVGQFMNYGVFEPPYWMYAYKGMNENKLFEVPDGLQITSNEHILLDASRFRSVTPGGQDPTLVVVQSYLWDLASEWEHAGKMAQGYRPGDDFVARWAARLQSHMQIVRQAFPTSRLAWRTAPPVPEQSGRNPEIIHAMNLAARSFAQDNDIQLVDYASMCEAPGSPEIAHLEEHIHPGEVASMAYMNVLLNVLAETSATAPVHSA